MINNKVLLIGLGLESEITLSAGGFYIRIFSKFG
jgi:hypothetical protein